MYAYKLAGWKTCVVLGWLAENQAGWFGVIYRYLQLVCVRAEYVGVGSLKGFCPIQVSSLEKRFCKSFEFKSKFQVLEMVMCFAN